MRDVDPNLTSKGDEPITRWILVMIMMVGVLLLGGIIIEAFNLEGRTAIIVLLLALGLSGSIVYSQFRNT